MQRVPIWGAKVTTNSPKSNLALMRERESRSFDVALLLGCCSHSFRPFLLCLDHSVLQSNIMGHLKNNDNNNLLLSCAAAVLVSAPPLHHCQQDTPESTASCVYHSDGGNDDECATANPNEPLSTTKVVATTEKTNWKNKKRVRFAHVHVRSYAITVGHAPTCPALPLSLDWKYDANDVTMSVDDYHPQATTPTTNSSTRPTPLTVSERRSRLLRMGFTHSRLQQLETQRRIALTSQWAYGKDTYGQPKCFSLEQTKVILRRYVV
jgi:hypothetical protein